MPKSIESLTRTFINLTWNKGHFSLLKQLCVPDFHYHTTFNERVLDFDAYVAYVKTFRNCMPDIELMIEDVMVKENRAMVHSILSGTIKKPFFGMPASDKLIAFSAITTVDVRQGRIESLDSMIDISGIQRQVGSPIAVDQPLKFDQKKSS